MTTRYLTRVLCILLIMPVIAFTAVPLDKWTHIYLDTERGKWGDEAEPDW